MTVLPTAKVAAAITLTGCLTSKVLLFALLCTLLCTCPTTAVR